MLSNSIGCKVLFDEAQRQDSPVVQSENGRLNIDLANRDDVVRSMYAGGTGDIKVRNYALNA